MGKKEDLENTERITEKEGEITKEKKTTKEKKSIKGIKRKLITRLVPSIAVIIVILITVTFAMSKRIIQDNAKQLLEAEGHANSREISEWAGKIVSSLNAAKITLDQVTMDDAERLNYLKSTMTMNEDLPSGIYIGDNTEKLTIPTGWKPDASYKVTERDWYKEGLTHDVFMFGSTYMDAETGELAVSVSTKLNSSSVQEVASADILIKKICEQVKDIDVLKTGYAFLIDQTTDSIIAHKDESLIGQVLSEQKDDEFLSTIEAMMKNSNHEVVNIKYHNAWYYVEVNTVQNTNWVLVSCVKEADILKELNKFTNLVFIIVIVAVIGIGILIERLVHVIVRPIKKLTSDIGKITEGDFTIEVEVKGNDEVALMSAGLKKFVEVMRTLIKDITDISNQLINKADNSSNISEELSNSASTQSKSMEELNITVDELAHAVSEVAGNATTLAMIVSETQEKGETVSSKMNETVEVSQKGSNDMEMVRTSMDHIVLTMNELEKSVGEVGQSSTEITKFVEIIGDIASQTNLLSLNASIEAARAGEAGKGFSVVADEIGKLAATSSNAVQQISLLTENITGLVGDTMDRTKVSADSISESKELVRTASETFTTIYDTLTDTNSMVQEMIGKVKNVDEVATSVAAITEEQSASAEEILATSETLVSHATKITENSKEVAEDALTLEKTAESLANHMKHFRI